MTPPSASLVWPTPDGGWAELSGFGVLPPRDTLAEGASPEQVLAERTEVAGLVTFGRYGSPLLLFRLRWLPSDVSTRSVASDPSFGTATFRSTGSASEDAILVTRLDTTSTSFDEMTRRSISDPAPLVVSGRPAVLGRSTELDARILVVDLGDGTAFQVLVATDQAERYPLGVMRRIAERADVGPAMDDERSWTPAPEALGR